MSDLIVNLGLNKLHENIAMAAHKKSIGYVWCRTCGRKQKVKYADCYANGWPKCCGYTMTIDEPKDQP